MFPPNSDEYTRADASVFNLVTNTAFLAPFVADKCDPETVGKSAEVVTPVTYTPFAESRAMPVMASLPAPARYVLNCRAEPSLASLKMYPVEEPVAPPCGISGLNDLLESVCRDWEIL